MLCFCVVLWLHLMRIKIYIIEIIANIDINVCIISLSDIIDVGRIILKQIWRSGSARSKLISIAVPKFSAAVLRLIMSMHSVPDFL